MRIGRRQFLAAAGSLTRARAARRPNIVFILADDLGIGDLGCYGGRRILTPHIDRLAAEGMRFTRAYAGGAVCAPSRSCLMTGQHTGHTRIRNNHSVATGERVPLLEADVTVAQVLRRAGYSTAVFGKWGLGEPDTPGVPNRKGFDEWFGFLNQDHAVDYYTDHLWRNGRKETLAGNAGGARRDYVTDLFTREALSFVNSRADRPFFLYLAYTTPHADHAVPALEPYQDRPWTEEQKVYAAMVTRMDRDIGRLMALLREKGLDRDTVVFFASDNGDGNKRMADFFRGTLDLREAKGSLYEGGIRVPAIARWPGTIPAGTVSDYAWAFWDFLPTAAELAGATPPPGIDGISIVPTLLGRTQPPHDHLYWEAFGRQGFRQALQMDGWKGVRTGLEGRLELYDLRNDPREERDRAAERPDLVARFERRLQGARTSNPDYPPVVGRPKKAK